MAIANTFCSCSGLIVWMNPIFAMEKGSKIHRKFSIKVLLLDSAYHWQLHVQSVYV